MQSEHALTLAGLTQWEAQAYRALLELGETSTGPLVKKSGIPQSKIYAVLEMLASKGLVNYLVKNGVKRFQAAPKERLLTLYKEKEIDLKKALAGISVTPAPSTSVELFEGLQAMRVAHAALLENVSKGETVYGYSRGGPYAEEQNEFYHWWGERKRTAEVKDMLLIYQGVKKEFEASVKKDQLRYVRSKTKFSALALPTDTLIFRNTIVFYHWQHPAQAIFMNSDEIAERYKEFFLQLWE